MTSQTPLERQEEAADNVIFGKRTGLGGTGNNTVLLERSDTNKVTAGSRQSELRIAWLGFYRYLDTKDNTLDAAGIGLNDRLPHYRDEPDPKHKGQTKRTYFRIPYWDWMVSVIDDKVITHQLTLWGYSREQFMNHAASIAALTRNEKEGSGGLVQQLQQVKA